MPVRSTARGFGAPGAVLRALFLFLCAAALLLAASAPARYALILDDPAVSARYSSRLKLESAPAAAYELQIAARQQELRRQLSSRGVPVTGSVRTLVNAVFVVAGPDREAELQSIPGVKAVVPLRRYRLKLNRAAGLVNAPAAWAALGGDTRAGAGVRIAVLDTGIDQTHPAFQDSGLAPPDGFPRCSGGTFECSAFTNGKVIVARSYVARIGAGSGSNPAVDSRPDDTSPRDRVGHGTAAASCAAGNAPSPLGTLVGLAPKAYLGNYKIFGSPGWNDSTTDDVIVQALEDALNDGMDIASLSIGGPAFTGALETGAACGIAAGAPCDVLAYAVENAVRAGMTVVAAAGNEGQDGVVSPAFNTISSPGTAPSAITVGASTNSHVFVQSVRILGDDVPSSLQRIAARFGDGLVPAGPVTAPLRDVTALGDDGLACSPLPAGSLAGAFALIQRGACTFLSKAIAAYNAGAVGVVFYMADQSPIITPGGMAGAAIPVVMISNADGIALKNLLAASPDRKATLDAAAFEDNTAVPDLLAGFSSLGPAPGDAGLKPEIVAVGTNMYMAAQDFDVAGRLYSRDRYIVASGTSFSAPLVSGAAALVKQAHPGFTPAQIKAALVNTATPNILSDDSGNPVFVQSAGAGKLNAGAAVQSVLSADPPALSFGVLTFSSLPLTKEIRLTNQGTSPLALSLSVSAANGAVGVASTLSKQSLTLAPGASDTVSLRLFGSLPAAGSYSGFVTVAGVSPALRIPFQYLVGMGVAQNIIPLTDAPSGPCNDTGTIAFKLVDRYGVPVQGARTSFTAVDGGSIIRSDSVTDPNGVAAARVSLGAQPGAYRYTASAGGLAVQFTGSARPTPSISPDGIVNGASFEQGKPVAPGSYISIFGTDLADAALNTTTARLPLALGYTGVTFDVPSAGISVPGRVIYVSPNQINVQVPWELKDQPQALVKVVADQAFGNLYTLPLRNYSPAFYEFSPGVVAALDANYNPITPSNGARRGDVILLYANGLGPVSNQPPTGEPAPLVPLAETLSTPVVTIGGRPAPVAFSGLAPGFAGLYQINVKVPPDLSPGSQPVTVSIEGVTSKPSNIIVR